jgi:hypothetical protein
MGSDTKSVVRDEKLQKEILSMVKEGQEMRKSGKWDNNVDRKNTERIKEIIQQFGWPGKTLVGDEASQGAWLLVQHADHDVDFQKRALELLKKAVESKEAEKFDLAFLTDRTRVNSGKPQVFGTQFYRNKDEEFVPRPIEDREHLEERRMEFGLEPFSKYERRIQDTNKKLQNLEKDE